MNGEQLPCPVCRLRLPRLLSTLLLAWTCVAGAGPLYRWVDVHGQVHFSDVPVPGAQQFNLQTPTPGPVPRHPDAATGLQGADAKRMSADCQKFKNQLAAYRAAGTITQTDALGKTHSFSDAEKQQLIALTACACAKPAACRRHHRPAVRPAAKPVSAAR